MRRPIAAGGDDAEQRVAGVRQIVVVGDVARADQLDAGFVEAAFGELPRESSRLSGRHEDEQRIGMQVGGALQERREVGIGQRHFQGFQNLAAALGEVRLKDLAGFGTRRPVRQYGHRLAAAVLDRPVGDDAGLLAEREARGHVIRRALGHHRGARNRHHRRHLGFGGDRRHGHRARRDAGGQQRYLVVDDQLLGEPLGVVGDAGVVAEDQLDLLAGDAVAMLRHVELGRGGDFTAARGVRPGHLHDHADLDRVLRRGAAGAERRDGEAAGDEILTDHGTSSLCLSLLGWWHRTHWTSDPEKLQAANSASWNPSIVLPANPGEANTCSAQILGDNMLHHFIVTRIGIGIHNENWYRGALSLFEAITFPTLCAQTCPDFTCLLIVDRNIPASAKSRLDAIVNGHRNFHLVPIDLTAMQQVHQGCFDYIWERCQDYLLAHRMIVDPFEYIITSVLDADDAWHVETLDIVQKRMTEEMPAFLASERRNMTWTRHTGGACLAFANGLRWYAHPDVVVPLHRL